ncbi:MAG: prepilin-type N-terminal cleavage/methylation domain-containing protein [Candidatus Hydrogenedentota bacterium]|nr:MAG: prepilin-type N-terminal cleavage/methylation domain-containing protein [Candidatus Hydrogenedentota bacterium]
MTIHRENGANVDVGSALTYKRNERWRVATIRAGMERAKRHSGGFTFVEILVVVLIIAVLSVVAVGSYASFRNARRLNLGASSLANTFSTARSYAISTNKWHRVVVQLKNPVSGIEEFAYWIDEIAAGSSTIPNPSPANVGAGVVRSKLVGVGTLPEDVRVAEAAVHTTGTLITPSTDYFAIVRFKPDGSADMASLHLEDMRASPAGPNRLATIKVYPATGKVQLIEGSWQ